jgi:hypothetical protein
VFEITGEIVSGHSLKHLLAAFALFVVYVMLKRRTLLKSWKASSR